MKAIIVDDEPKAIDLLKSYLQHFQEIELAATFRNGLKAFEFLSTHKIDLIFLDINMPHISGISLSKMIGPGIKVIFTTAYSEYAVESYDVEAVDYLLKPISLERFAKAVSKVFGNGGREPLPGPDDILLVKNGSSMHRIRSADILYLEKDGNYMTYHLEDRKILARESVGEALQVLPGNFIQAHKSFIVNTNRISRFDKESLTIGKTLIPVGALYREKLFGRLSG